MYGAYIEKVFKIDYEELNNLVELFEACCNIRNKTAILERILSELSFHLAAEEQYLYPILSERHRQAVSEAQATHNILKLLVDELNQLGVDDSIMPAKLRVLCQLVRQHQDKKEQGLLSIMNEQDRQNFDQALHIHNHFSQHSPSKTLRGS